MGGNYNQLENFVESTGFSLSRPYCNLDLSYDSAGRITSAVYWKDAAKTVPLESFTITYDVDGVPSLNGVEYRGMVWDPWRGRFVLDPAGISPPVGPAGGILAQGTLNNPASESFTYQLVTNVEGSVSPVYWPSAAETISAVSTSSGDAVGLTGVRSVLISGVTTGGTVVSETVNLNGITPVVTTTLFLRINSIVASEVGSNDGATGKITFTNTTSLIIMDQIDINESQSSSCKITVPTGETYAITHFQITADRLGEYEFMLQYWDRTVANSPPFTALHATVVSQSDVYPLPFSLNLVGMTDIAVSIRKRSGRNGRSSLSAILYGSLAV